MSYLLSILCPAVLMIFGLVEFNHSGRWKMRSASAFLLGSFTIAYSLWAQSDQNLWTISGVSLGLPLFMWSTHHMKDPIPSRWTLHDTTFLLSVILVLVSGLAMFVFPVG